MTEPLSEGISSTTNRSWLAIGSLLLSVALLAACGTEKGSGKGTTETASAIETKTMTIPIQGMSCGACAANVKKALKAVKGVHEVEVSLERRLARVRYIEGEVPPERLVAAINELGYKAGNPTAETP